ncbi:HAMP domain-containing sensor histidine kinase [soil metagenome]
MRLYEYIEGNLEPVLKEWEIRVRAVAEPAKKLSALALRDHAPLLLEAIAKRLEKLAGQARSDSEEQTIDPQIESAAKGHGAERHNEGFDAAQVGLEYSALRLTVVSLWRRELTVIDENIFDDLDRFGAAINQALAVSLGEYSRNMGKSKDTFIAILGHDLRTPLGAISMGADYLIGHSTLDEKQRHIVQSLKNSAARMSAMIKDLLAYTSKQLGNEMPITVRETDIGAVCKAAVDEATLAYPGSQFVLEMPNALAGTVDGGRVQQLLSNLLTNAVQHGENKTPVTIAAEVQRGEIDIQVKNIGPIIPPEALERIFDPLVRYTAEHPGEEDAYLSTSLGLGLYIARAIAVAHGGTITATSSIEEGTILTVRLPLSQSLNAA